MATEETIILKTEVDTTASDNSIKSLNSQLKELKLQLASLDEGSEAFKAAATKAGELREKIRGVNDAIENADPEKKFAPFTRTVQGLAGGFAAAQGAMALFGGESKALEQTLLKVQGAMALSQGLNSLIEFKNDFKDLGKIILEKVVTAFTTLRGALMATGIGALAIAVGVLVTNWDKFSKAITNTFPGFKVVTDFFKNFRQIASGTLSSIVEGFKVIGEVIGKFFTGDPFGAIESAKTFGERTAKAYNEAYNETDKKIGIENGLKKRKQELDLLEAQGKDVRQARIKLMQDELSILEKGSDEYIAKEIEIETLKTAIRKEAEEKRKKEAEKIKNDKIKEAEDDYKFYQELSKKELEKKQKEGEDAFNAELAVITAQETTKSNIQIDENKKRKASTILTYQEQKDALQVLLDNSLISQEEYNQSVNKLDEAQLQSKLALYGAIGQGLGSLSQLAGQETEAGKALAIAQATIDTYAGATREFGKGGILGFITGAAVIAAGLANVQRIVSVKVPKSSGGSSSPSISGPIAPPIISRTIASEAGTIGNEGGGRTTEPKPLRVVVLASDITNTQNDIKTNVERSTIK